MEPVLTSSISVAAYDRLAVNELLVGWTPARLRAELAARRFGAGLSPLERAELEAYLTAWVQRALGAMPLRDALLADRRRAQRVYDLICRALTYAEAAVPPELADGLPAAPCPLTTLPDRLAEAPHVVAVGAMARAEGLALTILDRTGSYPFPDDLVALTPSPPPVTRPQLPPFEQPTGWRRRIAVLLATAGIALLGLPMLLGHIPDNPAGMPLALLTLALLVGIKAGPAGYAGSLCIWLVANLPGFRHGSSLFAILWPAVPLMAAGLSLLWFDPRVRAMWGWLRGRQRP